MQLHKTFGNSGGTFKNCQRPCCVRSRPVSLGSYRVGCVGQTVELLLHLLQDVGGGAVLRFAVVDLIQDSVENLGNKLEPRKYKDYRTGN